MAIVRAVTESEFVDALMRDQYASWSHEGAALLFEYLDALSGDIGEIIEFDVVALRCDYSEASAEEIAEECDIEVPEEADSEELFDIVRDFLEHRTSIVGETDEGFVYALF